MESRQIGGQKIAVVRDMGGDGIEILHDAATKRLIVIAATGEQPGTHDRHPRRVIGLSSIPGGNRQRHCIQSQWSLAEVHRGQPGVINGNRTGQAIQTVEDTRLSHLESQLCQTVA
jgi:hypothetical protein